jgi:large subunit ribosomal protein L25
MATTHTLKAESRIRTGSGSLKQMRREGWVPSVVYGRGVESKNVKVNAKTFSELLGNSASENILVNLDVDGAAQLVFLQDVQHHPITAKVLHVDFRAIDENTKITAHLPLEFIGEPEGVRAGGLLEQLVHGLEVRCLPKDLVSAIPIDVSHLGVGEVIHIGEINFPEGLTPVLNPSVLVASVVKTRVAALAETAAAPAKKK